MQTILFNRTSNIVTGIDREKLPFEYSVHLPHPINPTKQIQETTSNLIQKTDSNSNPFFKDNIQIDEFGVETFDEVTYSEKVISTQVQTNTYKIATDQYTSEIITNEFGEELEIQTPIYETITTTSEIPLEVEKLDPIMIPEVISKIVILENNMFEFTYEEILEAKKLAINNNNLLKIVAFDEDFLDSSLILNGCSIGDGILILHGNNAELITPIITLAKTTSIFQIYIESQPDITTSISGDNGLTFVDFDSKNKAKLSTPSSEVIIKFTNTVIGNREIYCYGLLAQL